MRLPRKTVADLGGHLLMTKMSLWLNMLEAAAKLFPLLQKLRHGVGGWRDGSAVKNLAVLTEDMGFVSNTHMVVNKLIPVPRSPTPSLASKDTRHGQVAQTNIQRRHPGMQNNC